MQQGSETLTTTTTTTTNGGAKPHFSSSCSNNGTNHHLEHSNCHQTTTNAASAVYHLNTAITASTGGVAIDTTEPLQRQQQQQQQPYTVVVSAVSKRTNGEEDVHVNTTSSRDDSITDNDGTTAAEDDEAGSTEEDPLKLFVGQVPKQMSEEDIFPTFDAFGPLKDVAIIRDRHTGSHRGCAFVTYWSSADALKAQAALHDQHIFEGAKRPTQVKPAEPSVPENKLFIGMLSRTATEDSLRELFQVHGEIREIHMIRSSDGTTKCAAFLRFIERDAAVQAVAHLNGCMIMEGATRPLIVKFADTKHQRQQRHYRNIRKQEIMMNTAAGLASRQPHHVNGTLPTTSSSSYPTAAPYAPPGPGGSMGPTPILPHHPGSAAPPHPYTSMPPPQLHHPFHHHHHPHHGPYTPHPYHYHPHHHHHHPAAAVHMYPHHQHHHPTGQHPHHTSSYVPHQGVGGGGLSSYAAESPTQQQQHSHDGRHSSDAAAAVQRPREGPAGANLFVYHLPHDLTDADLATAFNPFGNVISAKVYVDKYTGESKGFGFVSYDSVISAEAAIEQMNGFTIGNKRLKVQHKRVSSGMQMNHPYLLPPPPETTAEATPFSPPTM